MGKSPGKWIKTKLFGKKSSKSNLSKDATLDRKTSITSKAASNNFDDDSMVISSPVPPVVHASEEHTELKKTSSVNITSDTVEVVRSGSGVNTANEDELIKLEQAAIKTQTAFRGYLARRSLLSLKAIILLQAHIRGHLARKQLHAQKSHPPSTKGNLVISTEPAKPKPTLKKPSTHLPKPVPEQPHSELEKVKLSLRKISLSTTTPTPEPEPESKPKPEPESEHELEPEPESDPKSETEPEPEPATNVESNGKENLKTKRRKSFPVKQESHVECVMQSSPVLPSYMAATESAKAKLRAQAAEDGGENGFVRRHSLPSLSTGKLSLQSPRVQKPVQVNGKGWNKSNKAQICAKDDKTGWKR